MGEVASNKETMSLPELAEKAGVPARTIRFYITRRLLPPPLKSGRNAVYAPEHLQRIAEIRAAQAKGLTLAEIALSAAETIETDVVAKASTWLHFAVASDVVAQVRADASPWRLKQIRNALSELHRKLCSDPEEVK